MSQLRRVLLSLCLGKRLAIFEDLTIASVAQERSYRSAKLRPEMSSEACSVWDYLLLSEDMKEPTAIPPGQKRTRKEFSLQGAS